jgi:putative ATP-binding cassette transporter
VKTRMLIHLFMIFIFSFSLFGLAETENNSPNSSEPGGMVRARIGKIDSWVKQNMKAGKIPGLSVVIVAGREIVYNKGFGYSNIATKRKVTADTLFELGSNSKAFTALGILKLEKEGRVNLNDPVKKYIPWFKMKYAGRHRGKNINDYVEITINHLLHHTSGIPFKSIGDIPISASDAALEKTVRTQAGKQLDFYPGENFRYATINYDILGLVIQNVSGESFEQYIKNNIIRPLGLNNTYLSRSEILQRDIATVYKMKFLRPILDSYNINSFRNDITFCDIATGYKLQFLKPIEYKAPIYRGNTPAGYFITNTKDLARWIKIQLGTKKLKGSDKDLITISHIPDRTVAPNGDGSSYASGWFVFQDGGGMIAHGGNNPNYSSYILLRSRENIGIGILANLNSSYTEAIANGIDDIIRGEKAKNNITDIYISIDNVSFTIVLISIPVLLATIYLLLILLMQIIKRERKFSGNIIKVITNTFFFLLFITGLGYSMYSIPDVLYWGLPWAFVKVWAPYSLIVAIIALLLTVTIFCVYLMLATIFPKSNDKHYFVITALSIISGFGNAIIIFIINEALNRNDGFQPGFFLFFLMGIAIYLCGQRLVRIDLLNLTNTLVYNKRIELINKILKASYEKVEQIEKGKIHAGLNNDTENISNFANVLITAVTSLVTLICCFVYLGILNIYGLLVSVTVIFIAAGLYFVAGRYANRLWEETRSIHNVFLNFINSLIGGFKELKMHTRRKKEFSDDMQIKCEEYKEKRIKGDLSFANVFVIGELLFTAVIGVVVFVFPVLFKDLPAGLLRNYVFVFLYMTGPVHGVLDSIPQIIRLKISYQRLEDLMKEFGSGEDGECPHHDWNRNENPFKLELSGVEYSYKNKDSEPFKVGPVNLSFRAGEIILITGGNGSGKSTLAKLITGLYNFDSGEIFLNNSKIGPEELRQNFAAVFYDYYLFEKLYGIDYANKNDEITELLKVLHIEDKLKIADGKFSTIMLSSGQRRRLALLVSCLEDRAAYLFDEWAADQDPEYRKYFYRVILPELKKRGKLVIAVTHDERYFAVADQIIKMETGRIVDCQAHQTHSYLCEPIA